MLTATSSSSATLPGILVAVLVPVFLLLMAVIGFLIRNALQNVVNSVTDVKKDVASLSTKFDTVSNRTTVLETRAESFASHDIRLSSLAQNQAAQQNELEFMRRDLDRLKPGG